MANKCQGLTNKKRIGRQTPTTSVVLPYTETLGAEAIELYNSTGRTAMEWQQLQIYDIMAVDSDGLFVHQKYGYEVPRRNGKGDLLIIRELWGLAHGEKIMHTAHLATTSHSAWERLIERAKKAGLRIDSEYRAFGKEHIYIANGGRIEFRTRTSKGGIGEGYDLLIIDEAQEYRTDQEAALKYVVTDSKNPQTILCGTPPTMDSDGTVFKDYRQDVLEGGREYSGWAEWSVETQHDVYDRDAWYETNPSLGLILKERAVLSEIGSDVLDHNIQRLGYWISYSLKSAISEAEWNELKADVLPKPRGKLFIGIKYGHDGTNVAMSIAVRTTSGKILVEAIDCQPTRAGNGWLMKFLRNAYWAKVVIDGANGQSVLAEDMRQAKLKRPVLPTVSEIIKANVVFEQGLFAQELLHMGQPALVQSVSNCQKRAIGSNGGFGYKTLREGIEVALLESVVLAYWACAETKEERKKQRISY